MKKYSYIIHIIAISIVVFLICQNAYKTEAAMVPASVNRAINYTSVNSGLIGYYTFDGKDMIQYVVDKSGSGNNARLFGPATTTSAGKIGQSIYMNADVGVRNYVNAGNTFNFTSEDFTIAYWLNVLTFNNSQYPTQTGPVVIYKGNYQSYGYYDQVREDGSVTIYTNQSGAEQHTSSSAGVIDTRQWHHIAYVRSGSSIRIYIDGVDRTASAGTHSNPGSSGIDFIIGSYDPFIYAIFGYMLVDEFRVYNRALTATEVNRVYRLGTTKINSSANKYSVESDLVGHWTFDGKDMYQNVRDVTGNGYNGTITGQSSTTTAPGKIGQAIKLDGVNDYISTTYAGTLTDFTVCAWFKKEGNYVATQRILDKNYATGFWLGANSTAANSWGGGVIEPSSPYGRFVTLNDGEWHHICSRRSGTTHTMIGDGGAVVTSGTVPATAMDSTALKIGIDANLITSPFQGNIDDVRIYSRALTDNEINKLYLLRRVTIYQ